MVYVCIIGVGRFWPFAGGGGGKVQNIGGPRGGGRAKLLAGCKLIWAPATSQCQIIIFLTLKTDNIAKLKIELKRKLLEIPSNKIKGTYIKLYICYLVLLFHIDIEGKCGWIIGGPKGMLAPSKITGRPGPPDLPLPTPMCMCILL